MATSSTRPRASNTNDFRARIKGDDMEHTEIDKEFFDMFGTYEISETDYVYHKEQRWVGIMNDYWDDAFIADADDEQVAKAEIMKHEIF